MSEPAILSKEGDISTITLDDGKVNVFSLEMLESIQNCLDQVSKDSGALIIRGREGIFSAGFDLKTKRRCEKGTKNDRFRNENYA